MNGNAINPYLKSQNQVSPTQNNLPLPEYREVDGQKLAIYNSGKKIVVNYVPSEQDIMDQRLFEPNEIQDINFSLKRMSILEFFVRWFSNKYLWVIGSIFAVTSLCMGSEMFFFKWIGENVLGKTLNFVITSLYGQEINISMILFGLYLAYVLLGQIFTMPSQLKRIRADEQQFAEQEVIRRVVEKRAKRVWELENNCTIQERLCKVLERQIKIDDEVKEMLKGRVNFEDLKDENVVSTLFREVKKIAMNIPKAISSKVPKTFVDASDISLATFKF